MEQFRSSPMTEFAGTKILNKWDVAQNTITDVATGEKKPLGLPKSNVLRFDLDGNGWFAIRPSGTEPKIKFYFGVCENSSSEAQAKLNKYIKEIETIV